MASIFHEGGTNEKEIDEKIRKKRNNYVQVD